ncbi:MAG: zinc-dependent alcohol dehydrogenase family protein [Myxococcaceae bacterium]
MKIRAAVLREMGLPAPYAKSKPLRLTELDLGDPGPGELLIRIRAAGLCHSDLSVIDGSRPRVMPMALGHEAAGEVIKLGPDTEGFSIGDHVVLSFVPSCGSCGPCREGRSALCEKGAAANGAGTLLSGHRRLSIGDELINHHLGVSAFADHAVVSARSAVKIDKELPWELAALFGCAVLTGVGAVVNSARVQPGESVAVFGLGGVGLSAVLGAIVAGGEPVIAIDRVKSKLELARSLGAAHVIDASTVDPVQAVKELTGGGVLHAIETVGSEQVLAQAYAATRRGGTTVTVGLPHPKKQLSISAVSLVAEERVLRGSYLGSGVASRDIPRAIALHRAGRLPVDKLLTHRLTLEQLNEGFDRLASGEGVRQVVLI